MTVITHTYANHFPGDSHYGDQTLHALLGSVPALDPVFLAFFFLLSSLLYSYSGQDSINCSYVEGMHPRSFS